MKVEVNCINRQGRPLSRTERQQQPALRGELKVFENRLHVFNRTVLCAQIVSTTDGLDSPVLPELTDAQLIWLDGGRIRLRGNELVGGALYAQTWDIRTL